MVQDIPTINTALSHEVVLAEVWARQHPFDRVTFRGDAVVMGASAHADGIASSYTASCRGEDALEKKRA